MLDLAIINKAKWKHTREVTLIFTLIGIKKNK